MNTTDFETTRFLTTGEMDHLIDQGIALANSAGFDFSLTGDSVTDLMMLDGLLVDNYVVDRVWQGIKFRVTNEEEPEFACFECENYDASRVRVGHYL